MALRLDWLVIAVSPGRPTRERLRSLDYFNACAALNEIEIVRSAREEGITWKEIGEALRMTESATRRKFIARGVS